jgi:pyruvyl transferase EpsO
MAQRELLNKDNLSQLKQIIYNSLDPLIKDDYCLLDLPYHENIGDSLIAEGEFEYLKRLPYKMLQASSYPFFRFDELPARGTILFHGGGNFGDLWYGFQNFRRSVIKKVHSRPVIIFPQTVYYKNMQAIEEDVAAFSSHPDLTICARDERSYQLLQKHFIKNKILMVPDMAFCLDYSSQLTDNPDHKVLFMKRLDKELKENMPPMEQIVKPKDAGKVIEVSDWPTFEMTGFEKFNTDFKRVINRKLSKRLRYAPGLKSLVHPLYGLRSSSMQDKNVRMGIDFINKYETVYATRLHGFILALLLGKEAYVLDNTYGKNSGFYNTWLKDFKNCELLAI